VAAAAVYLLIACLLYWPTAPWDGTHLLHQSNHDPVETVWYLAWMPWAIGQHLNPLFSNYVDVPLGVNLATNTSVPLLGALGAPITVLFGPITTFNLLMRLGLAGSGFAMFMVLRRWTTWWPAALIGGVLYAFNSFTLQQAANHVHLVVLVVPPLLLWGVDELFVSQRRGPVVVGLVVGVLCAAQWLINDEILFESLLFAAIGLVVLALARPSQVRAHLRRAWKGVAVGAGLFVVVVAYPAWYLVAGPRHLVGPTQPRWVIGGYVEDLLSPVLGNITHTVLPPASVVRSVHPTPGPLHYASSAGFLGIPLVVILVLLAVAWHRNHLVQFSVVMALIAFVLSLGARLTVLGHRTSIPLPSAVFSHIPLLYEVTPERITVFTFLFLSIVLAVGLDCTHRALLGSSLGAPSRHSRRKPRRSLVIDALMVAVAIGVAASFTPILANAPSLRESPVPQSTAATIVSEHTHNGGVVLYLPFIQNFAATPMVWQAQSGMAYRTVGGYVIIPRTHYSSGNFLIPRGAFAQLLRAVPSENPAHPVRRAPTAADEVAACRALPGVVRQFHVDSVVLWPAAATDLTPIRRVLTVALGPVPLRRGRIWMWDRAPERLRGRSVCADLATGP
jgi:hypothetical protein